MERNETNKLGEIIFGNAWEGKKVDTKQFVNRNGIKATSVMVDSNPNMPDFDGDNYKVTLRMGHKQFTVPFSHGCAICHDPEAADVLDCLASDAAGVENATSFEDWASDLGFDTDSRKAERTYKVTIAQSAKLKKFLGDELYNALLWESERI